jgi:hypothetical protein
MMTHLRTLLQERQFASGAQRDLRLVVSTLNKRVMTLIPPIEW